MSGIGIVGAGNIGRAIAIAVAKKGLSATLSKSRGPDSLADLVESIGGGITAGTCKDAAARDIVIVAVNWSKLPDALADLPGPCRPHRRRYQQPDRTTLVQAVWPRRQDLARGVAGMVPGARVVKAFNHLQPHLVSGDPASEGGKRVLFYSGDDAIAKAKIGKLIDRLGFAGIDLGSLATGARLDQFHGGQIPAMNLVRFD